jgi:cobalt/nickel transport system permease protein
VKGEGFLTKNISNITHALESIIINEDLSHTQGLLQGLDPRVKVITFLIFIITVALAQSLAILGVIFVLLLAISFLSKVPLAFS